MNTIVTPMKRLYALMAMVFMMFASVNVNAQTAFDDDVNDQSIAAPINNYVYAGILAAGLIGYAATRQRKTV